MTITPDEIAGVLIERCFAEGRQQSEIDEARQPSAMTANPYADDSLEACWWSRGYAHHARLVRALRAEQDLKVGQAMLDLLETDFWQALGPLAASRLVRMAEVPTLHEALTRKMKQQTGGA